jgi:signal transduction histidine kinase
MNSYQPKSEAEATELTASARALHDARAGAGIALPARVVRKVQWVLVAMAALIFVLIPFAPKITLEQKIAICAIIVVFFVVTLLTTRLTNERPEVAFTTMIGAGMAVCFVSLIIDRTSAPSVGLALLLAVIAIALVYGLRGGLIAAASASGGVIVASAIVNVRYRGFEIVLFCIMTFAAVFVADGMTRERRRVGSNLARLYEALRASSVSAPDLGTNLDAIVGSVSTAVGAQWCAVLLERGGVLEIAAPTNAIDSQLAERVRSDAIQHGVGGPVNVALQDRETVVVGSVARETRFPVWSAAWGPEFEARGMPSMVAVPLVARTAAFGVLTVHGDREDAFSDDDVALLKAYAEQIALVILRAEAFEQERESAQRLAEADQLKSEFLAMVSHELRTPLTAAKGFVDTVLLHWDRLDETKRKELLRRASGNANELTRLISQLLDFARIDANRIELKPLPCNLRELVDKVTADLAPVTSERTVAVDVDERLRVITDPDAFNHVLVNLITNANKFSPVGSTIHITAAADAEAVTISVADQGMGIAPDELEKVFERFYQSERTNMSRKGTGIGLAIVQRFVEHQGGRIWAESVLGEGATFKFTLELVEKVPPGVSAPKHDDAGSTAERGRPGDALIS